jgi:hypothetical protein
LIKRRDATRTGKFNPNFIGLTACSKDKIWVSRGNGEKSNSGKVSLKTDQKKKIYDDI